MKNLLCIIVVAFSGVISCDGVNGSSLLLIEVKNGITYFDANELKLMNEVFDEGTMYNSGYAAVRKSNSWYILSSSGIKKQVKNILHVWMPQNSIFRFQGSNKKYGFMDISGEIVAEGFDGAEDFSEGFALVKKKAKYNFINTTGTLLLNVWCVAATSFAGNVAIIKRRRNDSLQTVLINNIGKEVLDFKNGHPLMENGGSDLFLVEYDSEGNQSVEKYINYKNNFVIQNKKYSTGTIFSENRAFVLVGNYVVYGEIQLGKDAYWILIDEQGKEIESGFKFSSIEPYTEGFSLIKENRKYSFIDQSGNFISDLKFDDAKSFHNGYAYVRSGKRKGYIDYKGNIIWWDEVLKQNKIQR